MYCLIWLFFVKSMMMHLLLSGYIVLTCGVFYVLQLSSLFLDANGHIRIADYSINTRYHVTFCLNIV